MRILISIICILFFGSCAQLSRLDTGRTIGKGNVELGGYIALYGVNESASPALGAVGLPTFGIQTNIGLSDKIDINASLNLSGNLYLNPKFQIVGDQESALAVSILPGVDFQMGPPNESETKAFVRPHISAIISLHQDYWAFFIEPKYIYQRINEGSTVGPDRIDETNFVGATFGVEYFLNQKTKFALGYSYFSIIDNDLGFGSGSGLFNIGFGVKRSISR